MTVPIITVLDDVTADLILIDGRNVLYPEAYSFGDLYTTVDGKIFPTGGIHGFLTLVGAMLKCAPVFVCWEGTTNWRYARWPTYKSTRGKVESPELPCGWSLRDAVSKQESVLKQILSAAKVPQVFSECGEAEDAIKTVVEFMEDLGGHTAVISGDSDLLQLVSPQCTILKRNRGKSIGGNRLVAVQDCGILPDQGVPPWALPQLKAIAGDSSDDIPGVKGIGNKTAAALLSECGWSALRVHAKAKRGEIKGKRGEFIANTSVEDIETWILISTLCTSALNCIEFSKASLSEILLKYDCVHHGARISENEFNKGTFVGVHLRSSLCYLEKLGLVQ